MVLEHLHLLGVEALVFAVVIYRFDTLEQLVVERDVVVVLGEAGRNLLGDGLELVVGVGFGEAAEDEVYPGEQQAAELERLDGILEGRSLGVVDDGFDFGIVLLDGLFESRHVVFGLDLVERRYAERSVKFAQKRILFLIAGNHHKSG